MSTHVPIIGASGAHIFAGSDAPSVAELLDASNNWGVVSCADCKYIGRIGRADAELGLVRIDDPFLFVSAPNAHRDPRSGEVRVSFIRQIVPVEGWGGVAKIAVAPHAIVLLADLGKSECGALREVLVPAWEGRKHLRRLDANIEHAK